MSDPVTANCKRDYTAVHNSGTRPLSKVKMIVLHSTEGPTAEGAAKYFTDPNSGGSAHIVVDDDHCFRTLANDQIPWGAPGANTQGFHIEQAGYAAWTRTEWLSHDKELQRSAYKAALHAHKFGIPLRWVGPLALKLGRSGVTTHADCTKAFGGTHTDPGAAFPKDVWMAYATTWLAGMVKT